MRIDISGEEPEEALRHGIDRKGSFVLLPAGGGRAAAKLSACGNPEAVIDMIRNGCNRTIAD